MSRSKSRTRTVGTETRGDNATTVAGRRQIDLEREDYSNKRGESNTRGGTRSSGGMDGTRTSPDNQKTNGDSTKVGMPGAPRSLEDKKSRRAKRSGYNHPAAKSSNLDMFAMPAGGISNSAAAQLKAKVCPFQHKDAAAGLESDKYNCNAAWIGDTTKDNMKPGFFPPRVTDPITHAAFDVETVSRDKILSQGAAGKTRKVAVSITEKELNKTRQSKMHASKQDLIAHTGDDPPQAKGGLRKFYNDKGQSTAQVSTVNIRHKSAHPEPMPAEDVNKWFKMKQVRIRGGEFIYNVAGHEDLLPAATDSYTKADRPPSSAHRAENDKRWLPSFFREKKLDSSKRVAKCEESEDMAYIMGQEDVPVLGLSDRRKVDGRKSVADLAWSQAESSKMTRSASARLPVDTGDLRLDVDPRYRSSTPPPRGYATPRSYASGSNPSVRSEGYRPPARSQGSGSVYSVDSRTRYSDRFAMDEQWGEPVAV